MDFFTFPMETLNVTQGYTDSYSHGPHTTGNPKDYPIDLAGIDEGRSAIFARVDMRVSAIRGIGDSRTTNTIWLETVNPVITPTFTDHAWMTLTHFNNDDPAMKYQVNSIIPAGNIICYEGTDGASSNHIHLVCGRGKCSDWVFNTNGKLVMKGDSKPPEEVLYLDDSFTTTIKNTGGLSWVKLPEYIGNPVTRNEEKNQISVLVLKLNLREKPSTTSTSLGYLNLGIYDYSAVVEEEGYTWYQTSYGWVANNGEWLVVYPKKENESDEVTRLQEELNKKGEEIAKLNQEIQEKDRKIQSLNEAVEENKITVEELERKLDLCEKQETITFEVERTGYYFIKLNEGEEFKYQILPPVI